MELLFQTAAYRLLPFSSSSHVNDSNPLFTAQDTVSESPESQEGVQPRNNPFSPRSAAALHTPGSLGSPSAARTRRGRPFRATAGASPVLYHLLDGIRWPLDDFTGRNAVHHSFIQPPDHTSHRRRDRSGARPAARGEARKWRAAASGAWDVGRKQPPPRPFAPSGGAPRNWVRQVSITRPPSRPARRLAEGWGTASWWRGGEVRPHLSSCLGSSLIVTY